MKRVLYVEGNIDGTVGGSFFSLLFLIMGLDRARVEPIAVFHREHALMPRFLAAKIDTRVLALPRPAVINLAMLRPLQKVINFYRFMPARVKEYTRFLRNERIDLVHLNNSISRNHPWMIAARAQGIPCITHERGINKHYSPLSRRLGRQLAAVICISHAVRDNFLRLGMDDLNLHTIYNGLDPYELRVVEPAERVRARFGIPAQSPLIVMLGNIKAWKGQHVVAKAVAEVVVMFPQVRCLFVGDTAEADQPYADDLMRLIADLNIGNKILFAGFQSQVADFLNAADIVVHASVAPEPFGRVLLEAMALRKPLVGSRAGAVPEVIEEEITGVTFVPEDNQMLAAQLLSLLSDPQNARRLGEAGYRRLVEKFGISRNVSHTTSLYDSLLR